MRVCKTLLLLWNCVIVMDHAKSVTVQKASDLSRAYVEAHVAKHDHVTPTAQHWLLLDNTAVCCSSCSTSDTLIAVAAAYVSWYILKVSSDHTMYCCCCVSFIFGGANTNLIVCGMRRAGDTASVGTA